MKDIKLVKKTLIELLMNGDLESFQDVLVAHIKACPKSRLARETKLGRQTLYDLLDEDKEFNPTFKTLGAILQALPA